MLKMQMEDFVMHNWLWFWIWPQRHGEGACIWCIWYEVGPTHN